MILLYSKEIRLVTVKKEGMKLGDPLEESLRDIKLETHELGNEDFLDDYEEADYSEYSKNDDD